MEPKARSTIVSTKGQVILPKAVRKDWSFAPTCLEDVCGCLKYDGPAKSIEEMNAGIVAEVEASACSRSILTSSSVT